MYFIRHCESEANIEGVWGLDPHLSEKGRSQATHIKKINTSHIIASGKKRAQETAKIVYPNSSITIDNRFDEINFGKYEGISLWDEDPKLAEFFYAYPDLMHHFSEGDSVIERADKAIEIIKELPEDTVVFSHQTLIRCVLARLKGDIRCAEHQGIENGEAVEIKFKNGKPEIRFSA